MVSPDRPFVKNTFIKAFKIYFQGIGIYGSEEREVIRREFVVMNILRMRIMFPLLCLIEIINAVYYAAKTADESALLLLAYSILITIGIVLSVVFALLKLESTTTARMIRLGYTALILVMAAVFFVTYCELDAEVGTVSPYLFVIALGIIPLLNFAELIISSALFLSINFVILSSMSERWVGDIQSLAFFTIVAVFISFIQFSFTLNIISEYVLLNNKAQKLVEISERDPLTGVYNRRGFTNIIQKYRILGAQYAILMIDIDDFKKYNDQYYHDAGDICLQ